MSIGYCGYADLVKNNEKLVEYVYCCYNLNLNGYKNFMNIEDGNIRIVRDAFVEPLIVHKRKRLPSGRKKVIEKRIRKEFSVVELCQKGKITVKNASGTWETIDNIDIMALKLLDKLFCEYQDTGVIPEHMSFVS